MNALIRIGTHYVQLQSGALDFSQDWTDADSQQTIAELEVVIARLRKSAAVGRVARTAAPSRTVRAALSRKSASLLSA